ncbi:hypothetical protein C2G38_2195698 [Gigaspora rosea]|uniref:Uncharacterized protein n=1 Tax=Gigaspora rosea TaxID=44941 RepID=A0A397UX93_9GLOM|nr:hypothetical protein C2G38_2195698 [Gigaspora rosea]
MADQLRENARFHREGITSLAINKESALVLTGSTDGSDISSVDDKLNSWDVNTMRLRQTCHHEDAIIKLQ